MQLSKIMLAVAVLGLSAVATAAPSIGKIAISSGASASKGNLALALANRCSGVLTEFANGANISTYVCANNAKTGGPTGTYVTSPDGDFIPFTGSSYAELRLNVNGGSFTAVCLLNGTQTTWPAGACSTVNAGGAADQYVNPALASNGLAFYPTGAAIVGGLLDVEASVWPADVIAGLVLPSVEPSGFAQTFGVAVSNTLYNGMFAAQQASGVIPSSCVVSNYATPGCVPIIGKAQMASIMFNDEFNGANSQGAQYLAPSAPAGTVLNYARRVDTSGTQAAAQLYFMGTNCSKSPLPVVPQTAGQLNLINVLALGSTGNVRTQLNAAGYSIGVISGENNQTGQTWKWVRVGGAQVGESAQPADPAATITNTRTATTGAYDFWFESKIALGPAAGTAAFWNSVKAGLATVPVGTTRGLFNATETGFTKNGIACQTPTF